MWQLGEWSFDEKTGQLKTGNDRKKLEPQLSRTLLLFLESEGKVVTNDELMESIWANRIVTTDSIYRSIATLRKVLGDDLVQPRYILTIPKVGYQWIAEANRIKGSDQESEGANGKIRSGHGMKTLFAGLIVAAALIVGAVLLMPSSQISYTLCIEDDGSSSVNSLADILVQAAANADLQINQTSVNDQRSCLQPMLANSGSDAPLMAVSKTGPYRFIFGYDTNNDQVIFLHALKESEFDSQRLSSFFSGNQPRIATQPGSQSNSDIAAQAKYLELELISHKMETAFSTVLNEELIQDHQELIDAYPDLTAAYGSMAEVLLNVALRNSDPVSGQLVDQAIETILSGASVDADNSTVLSSVGLIFRLFGDFHGAAALQQKAIRSNSNDPHPYLRSAELAEATGDLDEEFLYASLAYNLAPNREEMIYRMLLTSSYAEQLEELKETSIAALKFAEISPAILKGIADYNSRFINHLELAIQADERLLIDRPFGLDTLYFAYYLLAVLGEQETAERLLDKVIDSDTMNILYCVRIAKLLTEHFAQHDQALEIIAYGEQILEDWALPEVVANIRQLHLDRTKARVYLSKGQLNEAYRWLLSAEGYLEFQNDPYMTAEILVEKMYINNAMGDRAAYEDNLKAMLELIDKASLEELSTAKMLLPIAGYYRIIDDKATAKNYLIRYIERQPIDILALHNNPIVADLLAESDVTNALNRSADALNKIRQEKARIAEAIQSMLDTAGDEKLPVEL